MSLVLASGSPRRRELLSLLTPDFTVKVSSVDETLPAGLSPAEAVEYLSRLKGRAVAAFCPGEVVVASDTVVALEGLLLGKPADAEDAKRMLRELSGRVHEVFTGVFITDGTKEACFSVRTKVEFYDLSEKEISDYVATGEPMDKAGAYGIQGRGALLVKGIVGDYYNVMGFPLAEAARALALFGVSKKWD